MNIPSEPEELEEINVEDLVNDNLFNSDKKLELLNEKDMAEGTYVCRSSCLKIHYHYI